MPRRSEKCSAVRRGIKRMRIRRGDPMLRGFAKKKRKHIREYIRSSDAFFRMRFRSETAVSRVLSRTAIYLASALPQNSVPPADCAGPARGKSPSAYGVASDRVYTCTQLPAVPVSSYLAFSSLPQKWRFFSVALSLGSLPLGVT